MCVWQISNLLSSFLNESIWNVPIFWMHQCSMSFWQIFEILWQNWSHNFSLTTEFFSAKSMKPKWQAVFSNVETSSKPAKRKMFLFLKIHYLLEEKSGKLFEFELIKKNSLIICGLVGKKRESKVLSLKILDPKK